MGEPKPIKEGALPADAPESYGGRDSIRRLIMSTRPEEFGGVADAYQSAGTLLDQTIKELSQYASRLVADGNWGGESARAMLGRMARVQSYLGTLRSQIGDIPSSVQQASRELATAKEQFESATQEQYATVDTGSYISRELSNDPDAEARRFLADLNGRLRDAHGILPERLPWDADLASSAPYLPTPVVRDSTPTGGGINLESTRPAARLASVDPAASPIAPGSPATPQTALGAPLASAVPGTATPPTLGTTPGQVPGLITSTGGTPSVAQLTGYPPTTGTQPTTTEPTRSLTGTRTDAARTDPTRTDNPRTDSERTDSARTGDPYRSSPMRSVLDQSHESPIADQARSPLGGLPRETGPSVRPGVVPVVDGTWPATQPTSSGGPTGAAAGTGGMPFMPMGGGPAGYEGAPVAHRTAPPPLDEPGLFRPAYDPGQPVVD
ncbi:hypothetical protein AB0L53_23080 [Nonomuraea sp. NPDC052129]|uniref:hypothetical protein n=1 Tax=Nonomuraea sp. NPDC052129 TaxID=3154651 RepID=UPI003427CAD4